MLGDTDHLEAARVLGSALPPDTPWWNIPRLPFCPITDRNRTSIPPPSNMLLAVAFLLQLLLQVALAHEHDNQIPFDYVKFPYQATYPGDGEGGSIAICIPSCTDKLTP